MDDHERLLQLLRARHACVHVVTMEEDHALELAVYGAAQLRRPLRLWSVVHGVREGAAADAKPVKETEHPAAALYHLCHQLKGDAVCVMLDLCAHLDDARTLRILRDTIDCFTDTGATLVLIEHSDKLPPVVAACATHFETSLPDAAQIEQIVTSTLRQTHREGRIEASINKREMSAIIRNLRGLTRRQIRQIVVDTVAEDRRFDGEDLGLVLSRKRQTLQRGGLLEFVQAPVSLDQVGGMRRLKTWLSQRQNAVTDKAQQFGLSAPRGVLMLGVQGAGKSMCAKAIATAWQQPLLRLDPGVLYDRYIGESERRLRDALHQVEMMAPVVLWIDEIEKAFASAASRSVDGGLSQRMFASLLTWMQEHQEPVFLVATANDIEALPPELLRRGASMRFSLLTCPMTRRGDRSCRFT